VRYLCLHGFTGSPASFAGISVPEGSVTPALGGHLDAPGVGSFWDEVDRLGALGEDCQGLFGYSLGGRLALGLLARYPARFAHAVIVSAQPGLQADAERVARRSADLRFVRLMGERGLSAFVDAWQALPLWASQGALPESMKQAQREQRLRHQATGLARSLIQHGLGEMPDLRPQLAEVQTRVDVLVGELDAKFVALGHELCSVIPGARLTIAPRAGHNLLLERPELCSQAFERGTSV
jgi:2-succinyl-6-hydroxy-2,4-cyclohexadiene-1-carboxylate synthase